MTYRLLFLRFFGPTSIKNGEVSHGYNISLNVIESGAWREVAYLIVFSMMTLKGQILGQI